MAKSILVVDDDKDLAGILEDQLKAAGFTVFVAHNGEEGFDTAVAKKPDLILLDVKMPKMDGIQMAEKLRTDAWGKTAEVVFLTVIDQPETLSRAIELGGYDYFVKTDWKVEEIIQRIKQKLGV